MNEGRGRLSKFWRRENRGFPFLSSIRPHTEHRYILYCSYPPHPPPIIPIMSTVVGITATSNIESSQNGLSVDALAQKLEKTGLENETQDAQAVAQQELIDTRPRVVYSRSQLIRLSKSPLVKAPNGMPDFKAWFGSVSFFLRSSSLDFLTSLHR